MLTGYSKAGLGVLAGAVVLNCCATRSVMFSVAYCPTFSAPIVGVDVGKPSSSCPETSSVPLLRPSCSYPKRRGSRGCGSTSEPRTSRVRILGVRILGDFNFERSVIVDQETFTKEICTQK